MPPSVVIDTNVIIAGLRSARGASFLLLERIGTGAFTVNVSVPLVLEYEATARRQAREIGLTHAEIDHVLDYICGASKHREIYYLWRPFLRDPKDDLVLELAVEAEADFIMPGAYSRNIMKIIFFNEIKLISRCRWLSYCCGNTNSRSCKAVRQPSYAIGFTVN